LKHSLRIPVIAAVAGLAVAAAGCSDSRMAANNAVSNRGQHNGQVQQPNYQVGYGLSSEGTTTDLYTELKSSLQRPERPQAAAPVQQATSTGQQVADSRPGAVQQPVSSSAVQQPAGPGVAQLPQQPAGPSVAQQPAGPEPTTTAYGLSSDGPTTDVYTAIFGPRNR
jgi:hypothetical protein